MVVAPQVMVVWLQQAILSLYSEPLLAPPPEPAFAQVGQMEGVLPDGRKTG